MHPAITAVLLAELVAASDRASAGAGRWRSLFNGRDLTGWDTIVLPQPRTFNDGLQRAALMTGIMNRDARGVFTVTHVDGAPAIHISGEVLGALSSREQFENYHFRAEFKW